MRTVISAPTHSLVSLTNDEILALSNSLNEVLHNSTIDGSDYHARIGVTLDALRQLHSALCENLQMPRSKSTEVFQAWRDGFSIQLKAISVFGDPADLSAAEVKQLLNPMIEDAEEI